MRRLGLRGWLFTLAAAVSLVYMVASGRSPALVLSSLLRLLGHLS